MADVAQPRSFAPSKEDVLTTLAYFFGAPVSPEKLKNYEEHHAQTCTGPEFKPGPSTDTVVLLTPLPLPACRRPLPW